MPGKNRVGPPDHPAGRWWHILRKLDGAIDPKELRAAVGPDEVNSLAKLAKALGMAETTVTNDWRKSGMPGAAKSYKLADVLVWACMHKRRGATKDEEAGPDSMAAVRNERYLMLRYDREEREGRLLSRAMLQETWSAISTILRGVGETLRRQFGQDAQQILDDGIDESTALMDAKLADGRSNGRARG